MTALVVLGDIEACLHRLQWWPGQSSRWPFRFCGGKQRKNNQSSALLVFLLRIYRQPAESSHKVLTVYNVSLTWRHHDVLDGHKITQQNKRQQKRNAGPFNLFINILFHMIFASHLGFPNITLNSFWSAQYCMGYPPSSLFICFIFVIVICDGPRTMTSLFSIFRCMPSCTEISVPNAGSNDMDKLLNDTKYFRLYGLGAYGQFLYRYTRPRMLKFRR